MATLLNRGDLIEHFKLLLSQNNTFTDAEIVDLLNVAYKKFIALSECLEDIISVASIEGCGLYQLPQSLIKIKDGYFRSKALSIYNERAIWRDNLTRRLTDYELASGVSVLKCYLKNMGKNSYLGLYGIPSDSADVTTITANVLAADTTIPLESVSGLHGVGSLKINNEVIHYTYLDGLNAKGCIRATEETATPAQHNSGAVVGERDILLIAVPNPPDLDSDDDEPLCDESYRETIVKGAIASATLSLKLFDLYVNFRKEFREESIEIRGMFDFKEPGKVERIRPFLKKYAE